MISSKMEGLDSAIWETKPEDAIMHESKMRTVAAKKKRDHKNDTGGNKTHTSTLRGRWLVRGLYPRSRPDPAKNQEKNPVSGWIGSG